MYATETVAVQVVPGMEYIGTKLRKERRMSDRPVTLGETEGSDLASQPLDDRITKDLRMRRFAANGCPLFGTPECAHCTLVWYLPRSDCDPPNECPSCPEQKRCPCGSNAFRMKLLKGG